MGEGCNVVWKKVVKLYGEGYKGSKGIRGGKPTWFLTCKTIEMSVERKAERRQRVPILSVNRILPK